MKKIFSLVLATLMMASFAACGAAAGSSSGTAPAGSTSTGTEGGNASGGGANIVYIVTGNLGDAGLSDMVNEALLDYTKEFGGTVNAIELNYDNSLFESTMLDVCKSGEYDLVVAGFYNLREAIESAATEFPDQKFIAFDLEMDFTDGKFQNVRSIVAKQNEGSFLAGALAALMTTQEGVDGINPEKVVGYVGAAENTAIQDFLIGYIEGVNYVDPSIKVLYSFVGNWSDTAVAKELAMTQFQQGADISYSVCGQAGLGVADAAKEVNRFNIGVDYDVAEAIKGNNPDTAKHVMTSCVKDLRRLVYDLMVEYENGTIEWGTHSSAGVAEGGMRLADNEFYREIVPAEIQEKMDQITKDLSEGKIEVGSAIGATQEEIAEFYAQAEAQ